MTVFETEQTLILRTLNSTRQLYYPTYAGVRMLASQISAKDRGFFQDVVMQRLKFSDSWRYKKIPVYKNSTGNSDSLVHEYRDFYVPSPLTSIAETLVLKILAENPVFQENKQVFSYRWPRSERAGSSYDYFFNGYKQRNDAIAKKLNSPEQIAVITDIQKFYPSVSAVKVLHALKNKLALSPDYIKSHIKLVINYYEQLLHDSNGGIPIGPAAGHILGNIALEPIDAELGNLFGDNYFRYVDDIVVVCHASQRRDVEQKIRDSLIRHNLSINENKTIATTQEDWHHNIMRDDVIETDNFRNFVQDLSIYLALNPDRVGSIREEFIQSGFSIPLNRIESLSKYNRFRYFVAQRVPQYGLKNIARLYFSKNQTFVSRAFNLKKVYTQSLDRLLSEKPEETSNFRRWQIQRIRRVVNSLFYLRDFEEWSDSSIFSKCPELVEQAALATALSKKNIAPILPFFGRGPAAFAELWTNKYEQKISLDLPDEINAAALESIISFRLYGVLGNNPFDNSIQNQENYRLFCASSENSPIRRTNPDLSYVDEFESLRLGVSGSTISNFLNTRHSIGENLTLDAMTLLSSEYRS